MLFEIDSEKANITVIPAKGSSIALKITQTARNNNELQGKNDLSVLKYTEVINRERVLVRAFISIPTGNSNITSLLNNDITVELPANCHLKIKNRLGDIVIKGVQTSINLNTEYSNVNISASGCKTNITIQYNY